MFTHLCVSAHDLDESIRFYRAVLAPLEVTELGPFGETSYGFRKDGVMLLVMLPRDGGAATHSNGGTIGFRATSQEAVDAFHAAGLANGGRDEGAPGPRMEGKVYGAYLRDPVGNKLCAYFGL